MNYSNINQVKEYLESQKYKESKLCEFSALTLEYEENQKIKQIIKQDKQNKIEQKQLNKALNKIYKICKKHAKKGLTQCKIALLKYNFVGLVNIVGALCYEFDYIFVDTFDQQFLIDKIKEELLLCCIDMYAHLEFPVLTVSWDK